MASSYVPMTNQSNFLNDFLRNWQPPITDTEVSSKVKAFSEITGFSTRQIQFITDLYRHRTGEEISKEILIDECEEFETGSKTFPPVVLSENSSTEHTTLEGIDEADGVSEIGGFNNETDESDSYVAGAVGGDVVDGAAQSCISSATIGPSKQSRRNTKSKPSTTTTNSNVTSNTRHTNPSAGSSRNSQISTASNVPDSGLGTDLTSDSEVERPANTINAIVKTTASAQQVSSEQNSKINKMSPLEKERWLLQNILVALQKEHDILDTARKCNECKTNPRDITFLPCGHFIMCRTCSEPVFECPTCRKDILATAQTFLS